MPTIDKEEAIKIIKQLRKSFPNYPISIESQLKLMEKEGFIFKQKKKE